MTGESLTRAGDALRRWRSRDLRWCRRLAAVALCALLLTVAAGLSAWAEGGPGAEGPAADGEAGPTLVLEGFGLVLRVDAETSLALRGAAAKLEAEGRSTLRARSVVLETAAGTVDLTDVTLAADADWRRLIRELDPERIRPTSTEAATIRMTGQTETGSPLSVTLRLRDGAIGLEATARRFPLADAAAGRARRGLRRSLRGHRRSAGRGPGTPVRRQMAALLVRLKVRGWLTAREAAFALNEVPRLRFEAPRHKLARAIEKQLGRRPPSAWLEDGDGTPWPALEARRRLSPRSIFTIWR